MIGQTLDSLAAGVEGCYWERYEQVVRNKTSHYTFWLPVQLGFHLADRADFAQLEPLVFRLGHFFQAQVGP